MAIRIDNLQRVLSAMKGKALRDGVAIDEGLKKCAEILLKKSQELVPVDKGPLKASGKVISNGKKGMAANYTVFYGGPSAPYAFIVHERLGVHHKPPTQAKYLSDAVNAVRGTMTWTLGRQIKVGMK